MATRKVGALGLDLIANTGQFLNDMTRAGKAVEGLAKTVQGAVGLVKAAVVAVGASFGIAKIIEGVEGAAEAMERVGMAAKRVHASSVEISGLRVAAAQAGVSFESLLGILNKFQINLGKSTEGSTRASAAMARLGIEAYDAEGKTRPLTKLLPEIAKSLQEIDDAGEQASIAEAIFGKGGATTFLDLINDSEDFFKNLEFMTEKARRTGVLWSDEQTAAAKKMGDAWGDVKFAMEGLYSKIVTQLAPTLTKVFERIASMVAAVPMMLHAVTNSISRALGAGQEAQEERAKWDRFFRSMGDLAIAGIASVGAGVAVVATDLTDRTLDRIYESIKAWLASLPEKLVLDIALAMNRMALGLSQWAKTNSFMLAGAKSGAFGGFIKWAIDDDMQKTLQGNIDQLEVDRARAALGIRYTAGIETKPGVQKAFGTMVESLQSPEAKEALSNMGRNLRDALTGTGLGDAAVEFADAADAIVKFRDAVAACNVEVPELADTLERRVPPAMTAAQKAWSDFAEGAKGTFGELRKAANDWRQLGVDVVTSGMNAWTTSFSQSFRQILKGAQGWRDGMRGVFESVTDAIADVLLRMVALRIAMAAIGAVGGAFGGAPAGAAAGGYSTQAAVGTMAPVTAADVPHFGTGAYVTRPTLAVVGDAPGGEAIIPAGKMGGTTVQLIDQRRAGSPPVEAQQGRGRNGERVVKLIVRDEVQSMYNDRSLDRVMQDTYGLQRRPVL